jgi:maleate isomerase
MNDTAPESRTITTNIGLLVPSTNTVLEPELRRLGPPDLSIHTARMRHDLRLPPLERLTLMADHAREVVVDLASAGVDVIVYGVTSGSFFFGRAADEAFQAELEQRSGCPVVSTSSAVVEALNSLGLARISVVTPYKDELNVQLAPYLAEQSIEVVSMCTGATDRPDLVTANEVMALARRALQSDGDGLFISCTGLPTLDLIGPLEAEIGRPVITSNQASFWAAARLAGLTVRRGGVGRLLA